MHITYKAMIDGPRPAVTPEAVEARRAGIQARGRTQ